jgi:phosphate transport system permease protein
MASTIATVGGEAARDVTLARLSGRKTDFTGALFKLGLQISLFISIAILAVLLVTQLIEGWPVLSERLGSFLTSNTATQAEEAGIAQALRGTFWIGVCVVVIAFPLGIGAGIYLEQYASKNWLTRLIDLTIRNLAGVPSIVFGILGFAVLVKTLDGFTGGKTVLAGGITVALLVLPIVIITSSEALRAVPSGISEAGFGVGATRWEVIRSHVLPYAAPGILTGTVLALARALGEAAPLLLVGAVLGRLGTDSSFFDPSQLREQFIAMPTIIADWAALPGDGFKELTAAAIVVMLVIVLLANTAAILLRNRYEKKREG